MNDTQFWRSQRYGEKEYQEQADGRLYVWYTGILFYYDGSYLEKDVLKIAYLLISGELDFNLLHGFFRIAIYDKDTHLYYFFGDNSGTQYFYIDEDKNTFSDSLLQLAEKKEIEPNYNAIYQLLVGDYILTNDTIINGITKTCNGSYYILYEGGVKLTNNDKKLKKLSELNGMQLSEYMSLLMSAMEGSTICAVCTGGTDSRTILSHLDYLGAKPKLIITGHPDNPDIPVAKEISKRLELPLEIENPPEYSNEWLYKALLFSDYSFDPVLSYRHQVKMQWTEKKQFHFEFGGVGGEFYKNKYFVLTHYFQFKSALNDVNKVSDLLFGNMKHPDKWIGSKVKSYHSAVTESINDLIKKNLDKGLLFAYNGIGSHIMRQKQQGITNNYTNGVTKIDPLVDRDVIALASKDSPFKHAMDFWQRNEVTKYCEKISRIQTDQGYSLSTHPAMLFKDGVKKLRFISNRKIDAFRRRLHLRVKNRKIIGSHYWDSDYKMILASKEFREAYDCCVRIGIVEESATPNEIPINKIGNILMIGTLFKDKTYEY